VGEQGGERQRFGRDLGGRRAQELPFGAAGSGAELERALVEQEFDELRLVRTGEVLRVDAHEAQVVGHAEQPPLLVGRQRVEQRRLAHAALTHQRNAEAAKEHRVDLPQLPRAAEEIVGSFQSSAVDVRVDHRRSSYSATNTVCVTLSKRPRRLAPNRTINPFSSTIAIDATTRRSDGQGDATTTASASSSHGPRSELASRKAIKGRSGAPASVTGRTFASSMPTVRRMIMTDATKYSGTINNSDTSTSAPTIHSSMMVTVSRPKAAARRPRPA